MKLDAYTNRDLQNCLSILSQCKSEKILNTVDAVTALENHLSKSNRPGKVRAMDARLCPDCGKRMVPSKFHPAMTCPACLKSEEI